MKVTIDLDFLTEDGNITEELRKEIISLSVNKITSAITNDIKSNMAAEIKSQVESKITEMVVNNFANLQMTFSQGLYTHGHNEAISVEQYLVKTIENGIRYYDNESFNKSIDSRVKSSLNELARKTKSDIDYQCRELEKEMNKDFTSKIQNIVTKLVAKDDKKGL